MIVADTSAWIAYLRHPTSPLAGIFDDPEILEDMLVGDLVLLEVLQGARSTRHAAELEFTLRQFPVVTMLGDALAARAAANFRTLRELGITIRKTADLIIGTYCIEHGHVLLHADRDFDPMARHLGLRTL